MTMLERLQQLKASMLAARRRVTHLWLIAALLIAMISSQIPGSTADIPSILMWVVGCLVVLGLGAYWVHIRHEATREFLRRVQHGPLDLERVEITGLSLQFEFLRFGYEVDLYLCSGERLAFGFWTHASAERLLLALQDEQQSDTPSIRVAPPV